MNQILINQQENQLININNKEVQNITLNQNENQLIGINNSETQNIDINQKDNQLIYISNEGSAIGISNVLVNGVSVVSGNVAYVVVPTKTSELENDSGYLTRETDPTVPRYIKSITLNDINNWNNKQDTLVSGTNIKTINNTSLLGSGNIEIEGSSYTAGTGIEITNDNVINNRITSYNSLTDLPTIPTKTSELINDNNFVESSDLASVAFSGSYLDLVDDPVIPQNTSDLYNDSGFITNTVNDLTNYTTTTNLNSMLNNKQDTLVSGTNIKTINNTSLLGSGNINISGGGGTPTDVQINGTSITSNNVANILTESAYDSTTNKIATVSDLPTVNDGTLTIQKNGTTIDTFTANSSSNKTINVTVPTTTSDLTNNSNFAVTNADNNFSTAQTINGDLTVSGVIKSNIIYCRPQNTVQLTAGTYIGINNLQQIYRIGNKLSVSNGQIKIGKGINYVKVSVVIGLNCYDDTLYSYLYKNNANYGFWLVADTSSPYDAHSREEIIPVNENDLISFSVYLANGGSVSDTRTNIIVEAIG